MVDGLSGEVPDGWDEDFASCAQIRQQAGDAAWVAMRPQRLGKLGWLMKSLKENISLRTNPED